jgi:hypothetical protein
MRIIGLAVLGLLLASCADSATQCQWAKDDYQEAEREIEQAQRELDTGVMSMSDVMRASSVLQPLVTKKSEAERKMSEYCKQ